MPDPWMVAAPHDRKERSRPGQGGGPRKLRPTATPGDGIEAHRCWRADGLEGSAVRPRARRDAVASGITPEQARLRGYQPISVLDRRRLHDFGFSQRVVNRAPGLLIPRRDVDGQVWGYQFRPDSPLRPDAGASAKYETRHGDPTALDVPPGVHADMLGDPRFGIRATYMSTL